MENSGDNKNNRDGKVISDIAHRSHRSFSRSSSSQSENVKGKNNMKLNIKNKYTGLIIIVVVLILAVFCLAQYQSNSASSNVTKRIDKDRYQALFLTNGQVYFGKMSFLDKDYARLTNIYYLQQNSGDTSNVQDSKDSKSQGDNMSLIKLGSEVHAPEDEMVISQKEILFFENLKNDGKVVKAINDYKEK